MNNHIAIWPACGIHDYDMYFDQGDYDGEWIVSIEKGFTSREVKVHETRREARKHAKALAAKLGMTVEDHG